ncbi:MAG: hypothetical protein WD073_11080 [Xanthobacteraceae bacterium]
MAKDMKEAKARAEASFKKKELQAREGAEARMQYEAERQAVRDKTARLKALRLAKEASDQTVAAEKKAAAPPKKPAAAKKPKR